MTGQRRNDPYLNFRFHIEITGLIVAGFSDVTGLQVDIEIEDHQEGGVNDFVHKLPKIAKYPNLVLKRGITDSDVLWKWHQDAVNGNIKRRDGRIILYDYNGNEKWRWEFKDAFPTRWSGPEFKGQNGVVAIETLELVHHGLSRS